MRSLKKGLKVLLSAIFLAFIGLTGYLLSYGPSYAYRVMVWQDADYDDYQKFDSNPIARSETPFHFHDGDNTSKDRFLTSIESHPEVNELSQFLTSTQTYAFLVIRNDSILFEYYAEGMDRSTLQTSFSVSKSILSLATGLAIDNGNIRSVKDRITKYLPELRQRNHRFRKITLEDLLRMRSGIGYSSDTKFPFVDQDAPRTYYHPDLRTVALKMTRIDPSLDGKFHYNNYNPLLIGLILERTTNKSISSLIESGIWKRIGAEYDASWSTDNNSFEKMESGFNARPIDFAKIGRLILNNGYFNEQEVISSDWIQRSTIPRDTLQPDRTGGWGYGYFWWSVPQEDQEAKIFGNGRFGQFLYVSPDSNTIIIRHGLRGGDVGDYDWTDIFGHISRN